MKVVGLIAEYNPFHNGHLYHIQKAKELTGADYVLVVMSGNYVQRGAPAFLPKHIRAEMALRAGASAVIELPVCFSLGSAEYFAAGAVSILDKLGCVDALCFGSECADKELLKKIAHAAADETEEYKACLRKALKKGVSFPLARQTALKKSFPDAALTSVLEQPNNILGIEYIKALSLIKSKMEFYTVQRVGAGYHDRNLAETFSSASAIRNLFPCGETSYPPAEQTPAGSFSFSDALLRLGKQVPPFCLSILNDNYQKRFPVCTNDFSLLLKYKLLMETSASLTSYMDVTEDLANRIRKHTDEFQTFSQFCQQIKTKDMTYARISRCLFHVLLNMTARDMLAYKREGFCQYARILGFRKDCRTLLSSMKKNTRIPLVTKLTQTADLSDTGRQMLLQDISASNLYESILTDKFNLPFINEYRHPFLAL